MAGLKINKKIEDKIQAYQEEIVECLSDIEKVSKVKASSLALDKAKTKITEITKLTEKLKVLVEKKEKLQEKWDPS